MTEAQAEDIVRRFFEVKAVAGDRKFNIPDALAEARELIGEEEVAKIEQEVNAE
jgi:hypothetical protein